MSVLFKPILRGEPGVVGGGIKKYYARIVYERPVTTNHLVTEIEKFSALSEPDIRGVIIAVENLVIEKLKDGFIIKFDRLGTFYPTIHSLGVENEEDVLNDIIKNMTIRYRPSERLRDLLEIVKFTKVPTKTP